MARVSLDFQPAASIFGVEIQVKRPVFADRFERNVIKHPVGLDFGFIKQPLGKRNISRRWPGGNTNPRQLE